MNRRTKIIALICSICLMMTTFFTSAEAADVSNQNKAGGSIRFGYVESEEYGSFTQLLLDMALELVEEGSIAPEFRSKYENINFENTLETGDTRKLWNDICDANVKGARYQFVKEAFFDLEKINKLLALFQKGKQDCYKKIWTIYTFLVWYDQFFSD